MIRYLKGIALGVAAILAVSGLFWLGLIGWGENFEHAAPLLTDLFISAWLISLTVAGGTAFYFGSRSKRGE